MSRPTAVTQNSYNAGNGSPAPGKRAKQYAQECRTRCWLSKRKEKGCSSVRYSDVGCERACPRRCQHDRCRWLDACFPLWGSTPRWDGPDPVNASFGDVLEGLAGLWEIEDGGGEGALLSRG